MIGAGATEALDEHLGGVALVDHHVHGPFRHALGRDAFEDAITESGRPRRAGQSSFDSQLGFALLRWCAPVLGLEDPSPEAYLARRAELGVAEVNRRFLTGARVATFLVDTGFAAGGLLTPAEMAASAGSQASEVVRLETVAEEVAATGPDAGGFAAAFAARLAERLAAGAAATKSILAYRYGFDVDPARPGPAEVAGAAGRWLRQVEATGVTRLAEPAILRHLLWAGVDAGLPLQVHAGFGDRDLDLHRSNPLLLTGFLRLAEPAGTPVVLLHCYPYHREAGYLAHVFPNVFFDVGLALNHVGAAAPRLVAESLELAPFAKQLYSSDGWGAAELHFLGASRWRAAMARVAGRLVDAGEWSLAGARRVATMIGVDNAVGLYRLGRLGR